jgi:hypothetical protein
MARSGYVKKLGAAVVLSLALATATPTAAAHAGIYTAVYKGTYATQGDCLWAGTWLVATAGAITYTCRPYYSAGKGGWALIGYW